MSVPAVPGPDEPLNSWEPLPGESSRAYSHFVVYRDYGPQRSLVKAAALADIDIDRMGQLSRQYDWVRRAQDYDLWVDRKRREAYEGEIQAMARRHIAAAQAAQRIALQRLEGDMENEVVPLNPNAMDAADTARLLELGVKIERMSRGLPTELIRGAFNISPNELQTWIRDMGELALQFIDDDRHDAYIGAVYALVEGRTGGMER